MIKLAVPLKKGVRQAHAFFPPPPHIDYFKNQTFKIKRAQGPFLYATEILAPINSSFEVTFIEKVKKIATIQFWRFGGKFTPQRKFDNFEKIEKLDFLSKGI